jgi:hypothetical protein
MRAEFEPMSARATEIAAGCQDTFETQEGRGHAGGI